jgi:hypothetical protein
MFWTWKIYFDKNVKDHNCKMPHNQHIEHRKKQYTKAKIAKCPPKCIASACIV